MTLEASADPKYSDVRITIIFPNQDRAKNDLAPKGLRQLRLHTYSHKEVRYQVTCPSPAVVPFDPRSDPPQRDDTLEKIDPYKPLQRPPIQMLPFFSLAHQRGWKGDSSEPMPSVRMEKPDPDRRLHLDSIYRTTAQMDYGAPQRLRSGAAYAAALVQHRRPEIPRGRRKGTLQSFQERQRLWDQAGNSYGTAMVHFKKSLP